MNLVQVPNEDGDTALFQGEVSGLHMSTTTDLEPLSGSTCVPQLPGNLVSWVMFDDRGSKVMHPSGCPVTARCLPGYKGDDCTKIGIYNLTLNLSDLFGYKMGFSSL